MQSSVIYFFYLTPILPTVRCKITPSQVRSSGGTRYLTDAWWVPLFNLTSVDCSRCHKLLYHANRRQPSRATVWVLTRFFELSKHNAVIIFLFCTVFLLKCMSFLSILDGLCHTASLHHSMRNNPNSFKFQYSDFRFLKVIFGLTWCMNCKSSLTEKFKSHDNTNTGNSNNYWQFVNTHSPWVL